MEYLVTMTTWVPDGTSTHELDDVRAREAACTRDLAAQGRVLRLWRPPLEPGRWRTIGLFAAENPDDLERTLTSMPLRVWRTHEITALGTHADDPGDGTVSLEAGREEYLVTFVADVPEATSPEALDKMTDREAGRAREPATEVPLIRLWTLPGQGRALGLWQAAGTGQMREILQSFPLADGLTLETVPLTRHPSGPVSVQEPGFSTGAMESPAA
jgi:muconolactone delta-isomerase